MTNGAAENAAPFVRAILVLRIAAVLREGGTAAQEDLDG
jgi:hypothetical protein